MRCLLVGDGDLSFSLSVAKKWERELKLGQRGKWSLVATCFDTHEELLIKYRHAADILWELDEVRQRIAAAGCSLEALAAVDARHIAPTLAKARAHSMSRLLDSQQSAGLGSAGGDCEEHRQEQERFDRVVFQFPHRGGKNFMGKNRALISDFFRSASEVLASDRCHASQRCDGEVVVTLLVGQGGTDFERLSLGSTHVPDSRKLTKRVHGDHWQVTEMAAESGFVLTPSTAFFDPRDYPDYRPRGYRNTLDNAAKGFTLDCSVSHVLSPAFAAPIGGDSAMALRQEEMWADTCDRLASGLASSVQSCPTFPTEGRGTKETSLTVRSMRPTQSVTRTRVPMAVPAGLVVGGVDTRLHTVELVFTGAEDRIPSVREISAALEQWVASLLPLAETSTVSGGMDEGTVQCEALTFLSFVDEDEEEAVATTTVTRTGTLLEDLCSDEHLSQANGLVLVATSHHQSTCGVALEVQLPVGSVAVLRRNDCEEASLFVSICVEALVMTALGLPTLQHMWTLDPRVASQVGAALRSLGVADHPFQAFAPVSILQHSLERQVCFWLPSDYATPGSSWSVEEFNSFLQQHYGGDLVRVCLKSDYQRSPTLRSHNYRLTFWSPHSALANSEITRLTTELYTLLPARFQVTMR